MFMFSKKGSVLLLGIGLFLGLLKASDAIKCFVCTGEDECAKPEEKECGKVFNCVEALEKDDSSDKLVPKRKCGLTSTNIVPVCVHPQEANKKIANECFCDAKKKELCNDGSMLRGEKPGKKGSSGSETIPSSVMVVTAFLIGHCSRLVFNIKLKRKGLGFF